MKAHDAAKANARTTPGYLKLLGSFSSRWMVPNAIAPEKTEKGQVGCMLCVARASAEPCRRDDSPCGGVLSVLTVRKSILWTASLWLKVPTTPWLSACSTGEPSWPGTAAILLGVHPMRSH